MQQAIAQIDEQLASTVQVDPASQEAFEYITSVPGLGLVCGSLLVMLFGRMQTRSADAVIAFTGLDPRPNDSGKKTGQRRLSKRGWPEIRRLMRPAAMSAARTKTWNSFYRAQRDKGLSTTAALVVLASGHFACGFLTVQKASQVRCHAGCRERAVLQRAAGRQTNRTLDFSPPVSAHLLEASDDRRTRRPTCGFTCTFVPNAVSIS